MRRSNKLTPLVAALYAVSALPGAQAYCYIDSFGRERCTISTGVRIGIALASIALILILYGVFRTMRQRSARRANLAYINTSAVSGAVPPPGPPPPGYTPQGGYPGGYYPQGASTPYYPNNNGYGPQYPPQTYNGQSPYASPQPPAPGNIPDYAPPPGPPDANVPQYQYAPPPGPPPTFADQKH
ncbi:hypothetical protein C8Q74DRAFT_1232186 [Fomes fomentarius]|nr:hypothetical protein C8Q74DRAFT_1232186 [Fomes fomentarius]